MTVAAVVNRLYACAASASVGVMEVKSKLVSRFCRGHSALREAARENEGDPLLEEALRLSSQLRYRMLSAPLPLCHPSLIEASATDLLVERIRWVGQWYSDLSEVSARYEAALKDLRGSSENPLWDLVDSDLRNDQGRTVGLLIKPARLVAAVRDLTAVTRGGLDVLTESQLRRAVTFDRLYVFGAGRWYPGFVFSAPRAPVVKIVRYAVLSDSPPDEAAFVRPMYRPNRVTFPFSVGIRSRKAFQIEADEARPAFDLASLMRRAEDGSGTGPADTLPERVPVRVLFLEQDLAVFVSAAEGATELTVDFSEDADKHVHRVAAARLEPGMAVLVRTVGGGDYIVAAADQIMGKEANELRWYQRHWKGQLRAIAEEVGVVEAIDRLKAAGSKIANRQNLRNWISSRSIRTLRRNDFDAIFSVIGLAEEADRYWGMMSAIDTAHGRAGSLIRRQLLQQVKKSDLSALQTEGRQDFELPGEVGGGSITAVRIVAISPEVVQVHGSAVHRMFDLGE